MNHKQEILKLVSYLLASLRSQTGDETYMRLKLEGYCHALNTPEPCNLGNLEMVVLEIIADEKYEFAPIASKLAALVRAEHYRKLCAVLPTLAPVEPIDIPVTEAEYASMREKADELRKHIQGQLSPEDWPAEMRRIGRLVEA